MRSIPNCRPVPATTALAGFDPVILEFIDELLDNGGVAAAQIRKYTHAARLGPVDNPVANRVDVVFGKDSVKFPRICRIA